MKIRSGFISNSSTSSFIICGLDLGFDFLDNEKKLSIFKPEIKEKLLTYKNDINVILEEYNLVYIINDDSIEYIGNYPDIDNNEKTIKDIKQDAIDKLKIILKKSPSLEEVKLHCGCMSF
jgi:hypothetical protein